MQQAWEGIWRRDWFAGAHVSGLGTGRDDHLVTLSDNSPWSGLLPTASHIEDGELCDILKALCRWGGRGCLYASVSFSSFSIKEPITYYFTELVRKEGGRYHHLHNFFPLICKFFRRNVRCFMFKTNILSTFWSIFSPFASITLVIGCEQARYGLQPHHLSEAEKVIDT